MGISFSQNPLKSLASIDAGGALTSMDQIDEGMQGQSLAVLGHISNVVQRTTREQKQFSVVTLEMLSGGLEVMVWPDVLERTGNFWQQGKLVKVTGKLRVRGDQMSIACEQVQNFDSDGLAADAPTNGTPRNGKPDTMNGASHQNHSDKATREPTAVSGTRTRVVALGVTESDDAASDAHLLREVIGVLLEYPGRDRVNLEIYTGGRKVLMELPLCSACGRSSEHP